MQTRRHTVLCLLAAAPARAMGQPVSAAPHNAAARKHRRDSRCLDALRCRCAAAARPALQELARGIWFTALGAFAVGPSIFFSLCAMHLVQWWNVAGQMLRTVRRAQRRSIPSVPRMARAAAEYRRSEWQVESTRNCLNERNADLSLMLSIR